MVHFKVFQLVFSVTVRGQKHVPICVNMLFEQTMKIVTTDTRRHIKTRIKIDGDKRTHRRSRSAGMLSR